MVRLPLALALHIERLAEQKSTTTADLFRQALIKFSSPTDDDNDIQEQLEHIEVQLTSIHQVQVAILKKLNQFE